MATKRIDIRIAGGKLDVSAGDQGYIMIKKLDDDRYLAVTASWKIIIGRRETFINCSSKAIKKKNKFRIQTRSGSLFLYNSTNNWYWYFRDIGLQYILDRYKIDTIIRVENNEPTTLEAYFSYNNGEYGECKLIKNPTLKYYGDNVSVSVSIDLLMDGDKALGTATISFGDFVIVEYLRNHRKIYTHNDIRVEDLYNNNRLDNIKFKSILGDLQNEK